MKKYFGYVRVSTAKQGEGVSLEAQRDAISGFSERMGLTVADWFEEKETAAKRGRPVFTQMLRLLRKGNAQGVIIHKIDRSARNLKDWSDLGELIDQGIELHIASESLDLHSRGGRLSADIQAVVASDFIRNLRDETRKGMYGRMKQGLYPLPAPIGYLDRGKGRPKEVDPVRGPLIRKAFELYGSGQFNLDGLIEQMHRLGLRNRRGGKVRRNGCSVILNNPFYMGLIRLRCTGETFTGVHEPLVSKSLFERVQAVLTGRTNTRVIHHEFLFRRLLKCASCEYSLIGEVQKGHAYYRCHTRTCQGTSVREGIVEDAVMVELRPLEFDDHERSYLEARVRRLRENWEEEKGKEESALRLRLGQLQDHLGRLTDAFLDGAIEKALFEERKTALLMERQELVQRQREVASGAGQIPDRMAEFLELAGTASILYESALPEEKRDFLKIVTSNRKVAEKNVDVMLAQPFQLVAERAKISNGVPYRDIPRTLDRLIDSLLGWFKANPGTPAWVSLTAFSRGSRPEKPRKEMRFSA